MDPKNQWEFPGRDAGVAAAVFGRKQQPVSPWEQPRQGGAPLQSPSQRGADVAERARQRADQIMMAERQQQQRNLFGGHQFEA
mmetsp:Transcript_4902/g.16157  ORF Transcript_4902/g.16157 Transcript_4902/m.16157 type:complete len:83 (-) Transcript_4902:173-421(-)